MMDLVHLRSFVEVVERGTVAAAAESLGYTPPAVSQHIAKLEAELGTAVFDRVGGRLVPTDAGSAVVPLAFEMLDLESRARTAAAVAPPAAPVVIAGFASAISAVVLPNLDELGEHGTIELVEAEDHEALRELALGTVDIALTQDYSGERSKRDVRFSYTPVLTDRLALVLPAERSRRTTLASVAGERWLVNGSGTRCTAATSRVLADAGITPDVAGVIADNTTMLELVAAGAGVTVVPTTVTAATPAPVTIASQDLGVERTIHAVTRSIMADRLRPLVTTLAAGATSRRALPRTAQ